MLRSVAGSDDDVRTSRGANDAGNGGDPQNQPKVLEVGKPTGRESPWRYASVTDGTIKWEKSVERLTGN